MATRAQELLSRQPFSNIQNWLNIFTLLAIVLGAAVGIVVAYLGQPFVTLFAVAGLAVFVSSVVSAEFGLLILVFLAYTRFSDVLVHNYDAPSVAKLFIPLLLVAIMIRWVFDRQTPQGWQKPALLLFAYGMISFTSLLYASDPVRVWDALLTFAKDSVIVVVIVILLQTIKTWRRVIWTLLVAGIFLGTLSVFQYATDSFNNNYAGFAEANIQNISGETNDYRSAGPIGDPNYYAQVIGIIIPLALDRFQREKRFIFKGLAAWAFFVAMASVALTYSRGGFLAMLISLAVYFFIYPPKIIYIPVAIVGVLGLAMLAPPQYFDRIFSLSEFFNTKTGGTVVEDVAFQGRASENLAAVEMVKANPLFGVGLSNFSLMFNQYSKQSGLARHATERAAHNLYLEVVAEMGLIGFLLFSYILYTSIKTVFRAWKFFVRIRAADYAGMTAGFGAALIGYLFAAFFIHNAFPRYFYLMIGLALSFDMILRNYLASLHGESVNISKETSLLTDRKSTGEHSLKNPSTVKA
jgi:putative inorganic carbon (hco3(-)) transporter